MLTDIITALGVMGGFEAIKYFYNRTSNKRVAEARADKDEFSVLREVNLFLQDELRKKEERFVEQTALVRHQNTQIIQLTGEVQALRAERAMKLCEKRACVGREPQSGY